MSVEDFLPPAWPKYEMTPWMLIDGAFDRETQTHFPPYKQRMLFTSANGKCYQSPITISLKENADPHLEQMIIAVRFEVALASLEHLINSESEAIA